MWITLHLHVWSTLTYLHNIPELGIRIHRLYDPSDMAQGQLALLPHSSLHQLHGPRNQGNLASHIYDVSYLKEFNCMFKPIITMHISLLVYCIKLWVDAIFCALRLHTSKLTSEFAKLSCDMNNPYKAFITNDKKFIHFQNGSRYKHETTWKQQVSSQMLSRDIWHMLCYLVCKH
jgi:hypothetical protein